MEVSNQFAARRPPIKVDARQNPRFKIETGITVHSRTRGILTGHTLDISESGIAAILKIEVPMGELVELQFTLPFGAVTIYAVARQRSAFRYGFHFAESKAVHQAIRDTCRQLSVEESISGER